jgi:hypothetical protein
MIGSDKKCRLRLLIAWISRAKDAAMVLAERGPPKRDFRMLHWEKEPLGKPLGSPTAVLNESPDSPPLKPRKDSRKARAPWVCLWVGTTNVL